MIMVISRLNPVHSMLYLVVGSISMAVIFFILGAPFAAALEILVNTSAVSNLIRQGKLDQLETAMQAGKQTGMQTMDSALMDLVERKWVSGKEAYQQANNKQKFQKVRDET